MQTVMVVTVVAGAFFAVEKYAPSEWRPSHLIGNYEAEVAARVESEVAAAKLEQQAQFDAWVEQVRLVNAQNLEQYRGVVQAVAANYQASYDRSRVYAEATARMQGDLAQARLRLASRTRQTDMGYINFSRMLEFRWRIRRAMRRPISAKRSPSLAGSDARSISSVSICRTRMRAS